MTAIFWIFWRIALPGLFAYLTLSDMYSPPPGLVVFVLVASYAAASLLAEMYAAAFGWYARRKGWIR